MLGFNVLIFKSIGCFEFLGLVLLRGLVVFIGSKGIVIFYLLVKLFSLELGWF